MDVFRNANIVTTPAITLYIPKSSIPRERRMTLDVYNATTRLKVCCIANIIVFLAILLLLCSKDFNG